MEPTGPQSKRADRGAGCKLVYLLHYCPDLNLIEGAYSQIMNRLRKIAARTKEALVE